MNSTHLYWEFVQSHRAASIQGPTDKKHDFHAGDEFLSSEKDMKNIFDFYSDALDQKGISADSFASTVKKSVAAWIENESSRDLEVRDAAARGEAGGSRLVRDHLWIEQKNHGPRDYC